jgi:hypothetical protein
MSPRTIAHFANVSLWPAMQPSLDNGAHVLKAVVRWFGEDPFPVIDPVVIPPSERISEKARIWIDIYSWNFDGFSSEIYDMDQACEILDMHLGLVGTSHAGRSSFASSSRKRENIKNRPKSLLRPAISGLTLCVTRTGTCTWTN